MGERGQATGPVRCTFECNAQKAMRTTSVSAVGIPSRPLAIRGHFFTCSRKQIAEAHTRSTPSTPHRRSSSRTPPACTRAAYVQHHRMWIGGSRPRMDRKRCEACTASSSVRPAQPSAPLVACVSRRPGCRHSSSSGPRPRSVKIMEIRGTPPSPASAAAGVTRGDINRGRPASLLGRRLLSVSPLLGPRPRCYDQAASTSTPGRAGTGVACSICDAHADRPGTRGA